MKRRIQSWIVRYLPAEIAGLVGSLTGGILAHVVFGNRAITALAGTW